MKISVGFLPAVWVAITLATLPPDLYAQHTERFQPDSSQAVSRNPLEAFKNGQVQIHFRSFFMATDNAPGLSDYFAQAAGGGLHYETAALYGFRFGLGGVFNYNLASSDFTQPDPLTGAPNRYEIGLFDVENPENRGDLDRLEELWLRYQWENSSATVGKQLLQTPFINYQDGRMRPTEVEGLWIDLNDIPKTRIQGGWLWRISPRSTVRWYQIGESIGLYPKGLNPDGTASGYPENLESKGIGLINISRKFGENLEVALWDQVVENIFNTVFLQAELTTPTRNGDHWEFGMQLMHQNALADGGNPEQQNSYFLRGGKSRALSLKAAWAHQNWKTTLAYTRVAADGRFLAPREWGREPFYTFMSRERIEGSGDSHSAAARLGWQSDNKRFSAELSHGWFILPDVRETALSKYAFPSFNQTNLDLRYRFKGWLDGLRAQLLILYKGKVGNTYDNPRLVINRVDMWQYNLVLNYYL